MPTAPHTRKTPSSEFLVCFARLRGRGHVFSVTGILFAADIPTLNAEEQLFTAGAIGSYADGVARELFDTRGRTWENVLFLGEFVPDPMGPRPASAGDSIGWALPYKATFRGLN